jgi:hypothetical protein
MATHATGPAYHGGDGEMVHLMSRNGEQGIPHACLTEHENHMKTNSDALGDAKHGYAEYSVGPGVGGL